MSDEKALLAELARRVPDLASTIDPRFGVVRYLRGALAALDEVSHEALKAVADKFLGEFLPLFGPLATRDLTTLARKAVTVKDSAAGGVSLTFRQSAQGIPVYGGRISFHGSTSKRLFAIDNYLDPDVAAAPKTPAIDSTEAAAQFARAQKLRDYAPIRSDMLIYRGATELWLVWRVTLRLFPDDGFGSPPHLIGWIDALSGRVVRVDDPRQSVQRATAVGHGPDGRPQFRRRFTFKVESANGEFKLVDRPSANAMRPTIEVRRFDVDQPFATQDNVWDVPTANVLTAAAAEAFHHGVRTVDRFDRWRRDLGETAAVLFPDPLVIRVGTIGKRPGYWESASEEVRLGDPDNVTWEFGTAPDVVAHELTHAVIQTTLGLDYRRESGAINEAICDFFAAAVTSDWGIFERTWLHFLSQKPYRNMADPMQGVGLTTNVIAILANMTVGSQPSHYGYAYNAPQRNGSDDPVTADNGGVHADSGVINHMFYLLAKGGTHQLSKMKINRIPLGRLRLLVLDMLIHNRIAENATFEGLRVGLLQSAEAIRPGDGRLTLQLVNACNAVGIGPILSVKGPPAGADPVAVPAVVGQAPFIFIAPADQSMAEVGIMTGGAAQLRAGLRYFISCQIMNLGIGSSSTPSLVVGLVKQQGKAVQVLARLQANPSNPIVPGGSMRLGPVTLDTAALPAAGSCDLIVAAIDPANPLPPNLSNAGVHPLHFDIMRAMVSP